MAKKRANGSQKAAEKGGGLKNTSGFMTADTCKAHSDKMSQFNRAVNKKVDF